MGCFIFLLQRPLLQEYLAFCGQDTLCQAWEKMLKFGGALGWGKICRHVCVIHQPPLAAVCSGQEHCTATFRKEQTSRRKQRVSRHDIASRKEPEDSDLCCETQVCTYPSAAEERLGS